MPNNLVNKTVVDRKEAPNTRERLASQFGQLDLSDANAALWAGSPPKTILEAIERLAVEVAALAGGNVD